mmetsp:Transcript_43562/g.63983  ORF Transcript_43562/g.63983 Transcript_43562/m.63983 type:complete len:114 (-) Transcript_43562:134-475(-)
MLDRSADAASPVVTSTVMTVQEQSSLPVSHADEQVFAVNPDKRFSCPGMDSSFGLSSSQFDVPGRQSMAPWHHKTNQKMPSQLGEDEVEFPKAYSQSPAAKVRCGISSFFKRK